MNPLTHIAYDQHVLIKLPSDNSKICFIKKDGVIGLGKFGSFNINDIVGYPLGTTFDIVYDSSVEDTLTETDASASTEVKSAEEKPKEDSVGSEETGQPAKKKQKKFVNKPVGKIVPRLYATNAEDDAEEETSSSERSAIVADAAADLIALQNSSATNKDLINLGSKVQKMTSEEIEKLKEASVDGQEIIQKIIESHENFHQKTVYSQEKYMSRKQKKFAKTFTVEYLTSSGLLQYLFYKGDTMRINDMSIETMAMLLNLGNVQPCGHYLVMDESGGLLVYALMERMFGGNNLEKENLGTITFLHESEHANLDLLKYSNYSSEFISKHIKTISVWEFFEPSTKEELAKDVVFLTNEQINKLHPHKKGTYHRKLKWYHNQLELVNIASKKDYDGLILNTTLQLTGLVPKLGEYLHGSRPLVCYSQFREPLLELSHKLYTDLRYLAPTVLETRCRPYQSIRGKIHPLMTMRGGGGYLLWCQKVLPVDPESLT
ncbi:hypothetical protein ACO0RG_001176 [Hanseniaspora osmophila]|uniref:tRNA (adenine(58)-N(1))-methyltransferase non-catalytic subunit TRM6 n=1 Tax=Hanseniaspora osmophila TaxID=56408 RepID=A0A1E5RNN2_9ASCO|nr:tRNA (adenine(58)-N(1))-methyltransferase non-catalytic subunit TRM6 [Hanseniaspora osmophila]